MRVFLLCQHLFIVVKVNLVSFNVVINLYSLHSKFKSCTMSLEVLLQESHELVWNRVLQSLVEYSSL